MAILNWIKSVVCFVLIVAMLLPLWSCGFLDTMNSVKDKVGNVADKAGDWIEGASSKSQEWFIAAKEAILQKYGTAKDGIIYAYDKAADYTATAWKKATDKATVLLGNVNDFISGLKGDQSPTQIEYAQCDPQHLIKDLGREETFNETDAIVISNQFRTEQFVAYYLSSILSARGYRVFNGAVYYKGDFYGGLIFTKGEIFIEEDGQKLYSCGFVQLVSNTYVGLELTDSMVQTGLIAVPADSDSDATAFIVEEFADFNDFSGIFNNYYFKYHQPSHYVVQIDVEPNDSAYYDRTIELYDFDREEAVYTSTDASAEIEKLYLENRQSFEGAVTTVNAISDFEDNNDGNISTLFVLDGTTLDKIATFAEKGADSVTGFFKKGLSKIKLAGSQFLSFDSKGKVHVLGSEQEADTTRVTNGIISTVGSGLAVAGTVASVVCVCSAGTVVVSAIVITTGSSAIVYNISNLLAGAQDVYYGAKGSTSESDNPVLLLFKQMIPDEKTATLVYHIWGIANTAITTVFVPITKAMSIAKAKGLNAFQTTATVIRASLTTVAKALATGVGAGIVANYVAKIVAKATNNENLAKLVGFGTSLVTGMLIYKGLDTIDKKLDVSGLYPKDTLKSSFAKNYEEQRKSLFKRDISRRQRGKDQQLVDYIADICADEYGIDKPNVRIIYDNNLENCGWYEHSTNTLTVNMRVSEHQYLHELADTIGHEMQHAWQYQYAEYYPNSPMAQSLNNYIYPDQDYVGYLTQLCEADAWEAGQSFSNWFSSAYAY